jgi:hypothetical protein
MERLKGRGFLLVLFCFSQITPLARGNYGLRSPWPTFEAFSDNKKFVAELKYEESYQKAYLVVSSRGMGPRREEWRVAMNPKKLPTKAFISDDGETVVGVNATPEPGYGDEVVAFYGRAGQKAKYSLEQFAHLRDSMNESGVGQSAALLPRDRGSLLPWNR